MARAIWDGRVVAESDHFEMVEGSICFPLESVPRGGLRENATHTLCPWKGAASYWTLVVDGKQSRDSAWHYPGPKPTAAKVRGHVAVWRGVVVER